MSRISDSATISGVSRVASGIRRRSRDVHGRRRASAAHPRRGSRGFPECAARSAATDSVATRASSGHTDGGATRAALGLVPRHARREVTR